MSTALTDQIADLLADRALLLGHLMGDDGAGSRWATMARSQAAHLAEILTTSNDEHEVAELVRNLGALEWGDEAQPTTEWWRSPLGRVTAASTSIDPGARAEALSPTIAGEMLGISRQRVQQLVDTGKLERHPDGGVTRASVLARRALQAA